MPGIPLVAVPMHEETPGAVGEPPGVSSVWPAISVGEEKRRLSSSGHMRGSNQVDQEDQDNLT
jgi:hypothetical protein